MPLKFKVQDSDNVEPTITVTNLYRTDNTAITLNQLFVINNNEFDDSISGTLTATNGSLSASTFSGLDLSGITFTPTGLETPTNSATVTLTVSDGVSGHASVSQTGTLINQAPVWATSAGSLGSVTSTLTGSFTVSVTDTNTNTISHVAGTLPTGLTLTDNGNNTATISGTAGAVTGDTVFNFTLRANDGTISVDRQFAITVEDAAVSWVTPIGSIGTPFELSSVNITVQANHPNATPSITLQSGSLPSGLSLVDNGNSTATISGTLNTNVAVDTTTSFTLRATKDSETADRIFSITEIAVTPAINNFTLNAIPAGFFDTYTFSATQADGSTPALSLKTFTGSYSVTGGPAGPFQQVQYQIWPGYTTGGPHPSAGTFYNANSASNGSDFDQTNRRERQFTFTPQNTGSATLEIAPRGPNYEDVSSGGSAQQTFPNPKTAYMAGGQLDNDFNKLVTQEGGAAIKFILVATTTAGAIERTFEIPLHPAPYISSGLSSNVLSAFNVGPVRVGYHLNTLSDTTITRGNNFTATLGFAVQSYNSVSVKSNPNISIHDIEGPSYLDAFSLSNSGAFSVTVNSNAPLTLNSNTKGVAQIEFVIKDDDTNARKSTYLQFYYGS